MLKKCTSCLFVILFAATSLHSATAEPEQREAFTQLAQSLIQKYRPSQKNCDAGQPALLTAQGTLACLLNGDKDVFWGSQAWYTKLSSEMKELMRHKNIGTLALNAKNQIIWHTENGKKNALLLQKYLNIVFAPQSKIIPNHYLIGTLLGYTEAAIKRFSTETFDQDKVAAQEWLKENSAE